MIHDNQAQFDAFIAKLKAWHAAGNKAYCPAQNYRIRDAECRCPMEIAADMPYGSWLSSSLENPKFMAILPEERENSKPEIISQSDVVRAADTNDIDRAYPQEQTKLKYIRNVMLEALECF